MFEALAQMAMKINELALRVQKLEMMNRIVTCNMNGSPHNETCGCIDPRPVNIVDVIR